MFDGSTTYKTHHVLYQNMSILVGNLLYAATTSHIHLVLLAFVDTTLTMGSRYISTAFKRNKKSYNLTRGNRTTTLSAGQSKNVNMASH